MQVTLETTEGLERKMRIHVPADQLERKVDEKLKEAAQRARLKGFRPGKVPMREVKRRFEPGIRQEVSSELVQQSFNDAVQQESVVPAGPPKIDDIVFMFQKELGEKIIGKFPSKNYGRISIITGYRLNILKKFTISPNCFFPKPKVSSMIIHFKPKNKNLYKIDKIDNLEKITNILFSNKRKMINKNIKKILNQDKIKRISELQINLRPSNISPEIYYKITELFEKN